MVQGMTDYHVVCEWDYTRFHNEMRRYLLSGWFCVGGVHTAIFDIGGPGSPARVHYMQAMGWIP